MDYTSIILYERGRLEMLIPMDNNHNIFPSWDITLYIPLDAPKIPLDAPIPLDARFGASNGIEPSWRNFRGIQWNEILKIFENKFSWIA